MKNIHISENPLIQDGITTLRDKNTDTALFRSAADRVIALLLSEAFAGLPINGEEITTPLAKLLAPKFRQDIIVIPIIRAGLVMLPQFLHFVPSARVGFAGLMRDEKTAIAQEYYWKIPEIKRDTIIFILDPMLATGGSMIHVIKKIKEYSPKTIRVVSIISAQEGLEEIQKILPSIEIFTGVVDKRLNQQKFIVPGLGDFGDRYFGTE